jgi:hypothetical protein
MNVTALISNRYNEIENRKRALRQKTADDAYRRNAQYFKPKFNPALEEIVDLLTGKKEKEHQPEVQAAIRDLKQQQENVTQTPTINYDAPVNPLEGIIPYDDTNAQTISILKEVRDAALAPKNPSKQDLEVASAATETIQKVQGQSSQASEQSNVIQLNEKMHDETATASNHTESIVQPKKNKLLFTRAISLYTFHMQMADRGFQFTRPTIYRAI